MPLIVSKKIIFFRLSFKHDQRLGGENSELTSVVEFISGNVTMPGGHWAHGLVSQFGCGATQNLKSIDRLIAIRSQNAISFFCSCVAIQYGLYQNEFVQINLRNGLAMPL